MNVAKKLTWRKMCIALLINFAIAFVMEICFSNYTMLSCLGLPHDCIATNLTFSVDENGKSVYEIEQIEYEVKNIEILYKKDTGELVQYQVFVNQYGQEAWDVEYPEKWDIISNSTRINLNSVTDVHNLKITGNFDAQNIQKVVLNSTGFKCNFDRLSFIVILLTIIEIGIKFLSVETSLKKRNTFFLATVAVFLFLVFTISEKRYPFNIMENPEGQDLNLVVEAWTAGQTDFLIEPSDKLKSMENPYDYSLRTKNNIPYLFDATYYEGKLCTYFGVTPIVMLLLPFYLLTGKYLDTFTANIFFMITFLYLLAILYHILIKRYVKKISCTLYALGYFTLIIGSGFVSLLRGAKYDIAVTCALNATLFAIICLLQLQCSRKYEKTKLLLAGGATGFIVLSKANFIVYYAIIFTLLFQCFRNDKLKEIIKKAFLYAIPLAACAFFQMWYNYARYGSILEFGTQYVTGANMQMFGKISMMKIVKGILGYLFTLPSLDMGTFPFLKMTTGVSATGMNTYSIVDTNIGLLFIPIIYVLFVRKQLIDRVKAVETGESDKSINELSSLIKVSFFLSILNIGISTSVSSINDEYIIDVRLLLILTAFLIYTKYISLCADELHTRILIWLCIVTILIMLPISLNAGKSMLVFFNECNVRLKNIFEFWT